MASSITSIGRPEAAEEPPPIASQIEPGQAGPDPLVVRVDDFGGERREGLEGVPEVDVLLADDAVALAVVAGERQLVANDAAAERPDRDGALGGSVACLGWSEHLAAELRTAGEHVVAKRRRMCGHVEAKRMALAR
jgi:hypothetical protein